jgi:hypothetical protein
MNRNFKIIHDGDKAPFNHYLMLEDDTNGTRMAYEILASDPLDFYSLMKINELRGVAITPLFNNKRLVIKLDGDTPDNPVCFSFVYIEFIEN